jgi:hypothetical protein
MFVEFINMETAQELSVQEQLEFILENSNVKCKGICADVLI